ncbi:hypothetical protein CRYUN_Cryun04dG0053000 [Craigia yunnanensis]
MDSSTDEIIHDYPPFFKIFEDGRVERYIDIKPATAGLDPKTGVQSKDVAVSPGVRARIFMPEIRSPYRKLPLLVHYHGGGFSIGSAFDTLTQKLVTPLVIQANIIVISIDYRLALKHNDSWAGLQWVATHANGQGPEPWLNEKADLGRVFLAGESAGANIAHYVALQAGVTKLEVDPNLKQKACDKVIVLVAEKDRLRSRGEAYYETLVKSGWRGNVEYFETKGEVHCFHVFHDNDNAEVLKKKMVDFIKTG